ncbi:MAG: hypothetical protein ACTHJ0_09060 [Flavipsychrobacter sp.]
MRKAIAVLFILGLAFVHSYGQEPSQQTVVRSVFKQLEHLHKVSFNYLINAEFPNDKIEQLKGQARFDNEHKLMFNDSKHQTVIYNDNWYYKADHSRRVISIINLDKQRKVRKDQMENNVFGNGFMDTYIDSTVLKYARITNCKNKGDSLDIQLAFPANMNLKTIHLVYSLKQQLPLSISMGLYYPWTGNEQKFKGKGTTYEISYYDYSNSFDYRNYTVDHYFRVSSGKVAALKFDKYKLITQL